MKGRQRSELSNWVHGAFKAGRKLEGQARNKFPWEAKYKDGSIACVVTYDLLKREELKYFYLTYSTGKRFYTLTLNPEDVLLYRKRTSKVLEHPTLTKQEVGERLDTLSQADLIHAVAMEDFSFARVEGVTFGELRQLLYIVGHIDTGLEAVHLTTFSPEGEEIDSWSGSIEEMDIELRPCELKQLESLNKGMHARYEEIMKVDPTAEVIHKVEITK